MKRWQILAKNKDGKSLSGEEILITLLANRGLKGKKAIEEFLNPPDPVTITPSSLGIKNEQLVKASKMIKEAIKNNESIIIYSDYDADGVCGAAILWEILNKMGAKIMPYIPHRIDEGYGFSQKGIDYIRDEYQADLIISVDHGINSNEKIDYIKKLGIKVIVSDHHVLPKKLPRADAIVHTTQLCGAGIAWVLGRALVGKDQMSLDSYLDLVAMATIADLVPLTGANRILVKYGLKALNQTERIGIKALIKETGLEKGKIGVYEVSHILAPRLNATGRIEHAMDSLRLLCTRDEERAYQLADHLAQANRIRQELLEQTLQQAKAAYLKSQKPDDKLIFLYNESYQQGVIGLVAGRLVEEFYRPAIVIWQGEEFSKASARSVNGFNIIEAIRQAQDLLVDAGGHPMAAGFTVETKKLKALEKRLKEVAQAGLEEKTLIRSLRIDCQIDLANISLKLYEDLEKFKPYGLGNPEPVFASNGLMLKDGKVIGADGKHLRLVISDGQHSFSAVAFRMAEIFPQLRPGARIDIAYSLSLNQWNGEKRLELKIKDIKTSLRSPNNQ
jgi:single-stranded-DNA-specific exonuclease